MSDKNLTDGRDFEDASKRFPYPETADESSYLLRDRIWEGWKSVLSKYEFRDRHGGSISDIVTERFVEVIENEREYFDAQGNPLIYCREYRELKACFCNAAHLSNKPIHNFFGLTYASHLVLRRVVLQSAPVEWQRKFVQLLDELGDLFDDCYLEGEFAVYLRDERGRLQIDGDADYERGRRRLPLKLH